MLQHGHTEGRIERVVPEREFAGIGRGEPDADIVRARRVDRLEHAREDQIDPEKPHLGDAELPETDISGADAAAHIENAVAGARLQGLAKELREISVPPALAEMFERGGGECVNVAGHGEYNGD